ncbi:uncharacterized protein [Macrobrachium rosenbergii]|uniref:uncharacterized protein n=1 Tax=Macrobrachium rosenbergii TaxID=79674 RepID=UPI0034D755E9
MVTFGVLLITLSFASIWTTSEAQVGMSLLSQVLPRDTFLIGNPAVRPDGGFINGPPPPSLPPLVPFRQAALNQRVHDSSQDPVFHRPVLPPQNYPLQVNPLRQDQPRPDQQRQDQQRRDQLRPSTSRFSVDQQVPQLPVVPPRADIPQTPLATVANGSPLTHQTIPQRGTVPETSFGSFGGDFSTSVHQPGNTQSNPQRPPPTKTPVVSTGSFSSSGVSHNFPVNSQRKPVGQVPRRHPMCGVTPPTGDCRAAFPRYYYNPRTDQCDCFLYGGCGQEGLKYSYRTLEECVATCHPLNTEEGPVCEELFSEEVFFDTPVEKPVSVNQIATNPNTDHLSDGEILYIFANSVSPQELAARESNRVRQRTRLPGTFLTSPIG